MRLNRVYAAQPLATGAEVTLPDAAAYHVARVLRLRPGAVLALFDGAGGEFHGEIVAVEGDQVRVRVGTRAAALRESPLGITLVQGVSRSERMDWTLQKATELGVRCIQPVLAARSVVRLDERQADKKLRHWQAIVAGACEQSGRRALPEVVCRSTCDAGWPSPRARAGDSSSVPVARPRSRASRRSRPRSNC